MQESYFDGGLGGLIINRILASLIIVFTLGICTPWALTIMYKWKAEHTVIEGRRLQFNGNAMSLFGNWIKWFLLMIITFGIYGFWISIKLEQWITKNTSFQN